MQYGEQQPHYFLEQSVTFNKRYFDWVTIFFEQITLGLGLFDSEMMNWTSTRQPLGYFDLPTEIRLQILELTGLKPAAAHLAPVFRYVPSERHCLGISEELQLFTEPNPVVAKPASTFGYVPIWKGRLGIPEDWRKKTNPLCYICAKNTSSDSYCLQRRFGPHYSSQKLGRHYSRQSYHLWTWTCNCRSIPFSLFFVNKQMRAEVEYTLLKFNGLEFFPSMALDVCQYFSRLTEDKLRLIRDLRFTFSHQQLEWEHWNERGRNDWRLLLNWIKHSENLRNLRLVIDADSHSILLDCLFPLEESGYEDDPSYISFHRMLCEIALEVVVIREKLQGLHLRLPYLCGLEKPLEQEVMGSEYDSCQGSGLWQTSERRLPFCSRLPPWHDVVWEKLTSKYRELATTIPGY